MLESLRAQREAAPLVERPGIDHLIDQVERERVVARVEMERFLRDLLDGPVWSEVARRFGRPNAGVAEGSNAGRKSS
jgi:hypothetical protein